MPGCRHALSVAPPARWTVESVEEGVGPNALFGFADTTLPLPLCAGCVKPE